MTRRFDTFGFIAGVLCATTALFVLLGPGELAAADLRLVGPVAVLVLGVALLAGGGRRTPPESDDTVPSSGQDAARSSEQDAPSA